MSGKASKTARASMVTGPVTKKVVPDMELVHQYRLNRAAKLWPPLEQSDAVLRVMDEGINAFNELNIELGKAKADLETVAGELLQARRDLVLANSIIETKTKALNDIAVAAGLDPATLKVGG